MSKAIARQESERGRAVDLILDPAMRKASIIMAVLNSGQHLAASSVLVMNVQTIMAGRSHGGDVHMINGSVTNQGIVYGDGRMVYGDGLVSDQMAAVLFGATMLVSATFGSLLIDRCVIDARRLIVTWSDPD